MTSKERLQTVLSHKDADRIALDFGATTVTGLHCIIVEKLREYYGLERRPVRIIDPFQMLGEVDVFGNQYSLSPRGDLFMQSRFINIKHIFASPYTDSIYTYEI